MYVYGACLLYVCCSDCVGVCGNVCCVAAVVKDSVLALLARWMEMLAGGPQAGGSDSPTSKFHGSG